MGNIAVPEDYKDFSNITLTFERDEYEKLKERAKEVEKPLAVYMIDAVRMQYTYDKKVKERVAEAKAQAKELDGKEYDDEELDALVLAIMRNEEKHRAEAEALAKIKAEDEEPDIESDEEYYRFMESKGGQKHRVEFWNLPPKA